MRFVFFALIVLSALMLSQVQADVVLKTTTKLGQFSEFLHDYQLVMDNGSLGSATLFASSIFEDNTTLVNVPGSGAPFASSETVWPFNGEYGAFCQWGGNLRLIVSSSVGPSELIVYDVSLLPPTIRSTLRLRSTNAVYLLTVDQQRQGAWLASGSQFIFVSGYGTGKISTSIISDPFVNTRYAGFTVTSYQGGQPTGVVVEDVMYAVVLNLKAGRAVMLQLNIAIGANNLPTLTYNPSSAALELPQMAYKVMGSCDDQIFILPQADGNLVVALPTPTLYPNATDGYYCNGDSWPRVQFLVLNPQTLESVAGAVTGPPTLWYHHLYIRAFRSGSYLIASAHPTSAINNYDSTYFFGLSYQNKGIVSVDPGFSVPFDEQYNFVNKGVLVAQDTQVMLIDEWLYNIVAV